VTKTPRYTLPGPCVSWAFQGRDDRWYRVCVPCDTIIPQGGTLPSHLGWGWADPGDAMMSVRDHVRTMEANRHAHKRALERRRRIAWAAMHEDFELFGQLITGDVNWQPRGVPREEQLKIMAEYLMRRDH
jgi:hypothetical protein